MLFNSLDFAVFLPVVFVLYWALCSTSLRTQNGILLAASYLFYAWWDWRFLSLIIISSSVDFLVGQQLGKSSSRSRRRLLLACSIAFNLGFLLAFKYFNFFIESFTDLLGLFSLQVNPWSINVILPIGISFYTFQTLSYTIDLYREKRKPANDAVAFFAYVAFFPQLVAGPIERSTHLLPQFQRIRRFDLEKSSDGLRQILWGLFKKIVVADSCAIYVDHVFGSDSPQSGSTVALAGVLFAMQIYGDFSGYSDIAIGTARLFGFDLIRNFAFPYFSRDMGEFWRRWHISLNTWFRDYLYIPLGGSRHGKLVQVRNTFIIFLVSGLWHGANFTFLAWGLLNAIYLLPSILLDKNRRYTEEISTDKLLPGVRESAQILFTFSLTVIGWILFRANDLDQAVEMLRSVFSTDLFQAPEPVDISLASTIIFMLAVEWFQRDKQHGLEINQVSRWFRWPAYYAILLSMLVLGTYNEQEFIYFQF